MLLMFSHSILQLCWICWLILIVFFGAVIGGIVIKCHRQTMTFYFLFSKLGSPYFFLLLIFCGQNCVEYKPWQWISTNLRQPSSFALQYDVNYWIILSDLYVPSISNLFRVLMIKGCFFFLMMILWITFLDLLYWTILLPLWWIL